MASATSCGVRPRHQRGDDSLRILGHRQAALDRSEPRLDELALEVAIGTTEGGAGAAQDQAANPSRIAGYEFLRDHASERVPDQMRRLQRQLVEELGERRGERFEGHGRQRRRISEAGSIPRDAIECVGKAIELMVEASRAAADAVQEHDRIAATPTQIGDAHGAPALNSSRSLFFRILPIALRGSASTNTTSRGCLKRAILS